MDTQHKPTKKQLHAAQYRIYAIAILITAALSEFVWTVYNVLHRNTELYFTLVYAILLLMCAKLVYRRLKRGGAVDPADDPTLYALHDQYLKRLLHSIALFIAAFTVFIGAELSFYFFGNSKSAELAENMASNLLLIQLPLYLLIKNALGLRFVTR